ncbi:MAG: ABC transporter substrate-binding protein, partial [Bacillota bacterium]
MQILKRLLCVGLSLVIAVPFLYGCSKEEEKAAVKVTLCEVTHSIFYAPQYAAMNLGYFQEEGI